MRSRTRPRRPAGFTLVELLVSAAIALVVVAALVAAYLATVQGSRYNDARLQMTEDAAMALNVVRQHVAQAGFGVARGVAGGRLVVPSFPAVRGCEAGSFADLGAPVTAPLACRPAPGSGPDLSDTLEVAHESSALPAASSNGILGGAGGGQPLDCLGNTFPKTHDAIVGDYWLDEAKFYVEGGSLMCHGPGNAAGAALMQDVETLQVTYGVAAADPGTPGGGQVAFYDSAPAADSTEWARVVAVSVCIQVRSASKVVDGRAAATLGAWIDCRNVLRRASDGYLRRAFSTTVVLHNRLP
ncbi:MAG: PilW family protein [Burkholderiaceae bacterium]